ncbi:tRNA lysidine(34) synthetase TilS [Flavobacterium terrigena]|uniref:tRNA(Ile)-lysidine synthase n=1 Tax=Flavobacterium terrigena TaxID=402734 RepID=A0A1H6UMA9_9FLAO|nr:tRNA lysidine(34) synthetase TilS [Flavobacterium terrigena]SEI92806.1 tRNA(Ile)-lysidine synthase [Flavobacterium terrigena]
MFINFQNHIQKNFSFLQDKKLLVATSGGMDSMVLVHLFQKLQFKFALAHCNFQLREKESDGDENFVKEYAKSNNIICFVTKFDTEKYSQEHKLSTQVAARNLRYNWFNEVLEHENFDYIVTAHHADDVAETFMINLSRGTGLDGLTGIPSQNGTIIRPMLPFSRKEIEDYVSENDLQWREDSSNASDKYLRNKIRHHIVPVFKEINSSFLQSFQNTLEHLNQEQSLVNDAVQMVYEKIVSEENGQLKIDISGLVEYKNYKAYLYQWLYKYGFSAWEDIYSLIVAQSGKQIFSENYILLKDRDYLILFRKENDHFEEIIINSITEKPNFPLKLTLCNLSDISNQLKSVIFVDESKLQFPLTIRKWKEGDYFYPAGMQGKKKVSKYFKDEKFTLFQKHETWILESNNQIVWIIGNRADERFKTENTTQTTIKIAFNEEDI